MNSPQKISAVIFDMDGLMLDSERVYRRIWQKAIRHFGYELTNDMHGQILGRGRTGALAKVVEFFGDTFPVDHFIPHIQAVEADEFAREPVPIKDGLIELLDFLDTTSLGRAVATSSRREVAFPRMELSGIFDRFSIFVTGDEVTHTKPAPDLFLLAASRLQVLPEHCIVLEDSVTGVEAAVAAGMSAVWIPDLLDPTHEISKKARHVLTSLVDVRRLIEGESQFFVSS
jgi:HAD superfamily hydrolase (TIGR01509 family)